MLPADIDFPNRCDSRHAKKVVVAETNGLKSGGQTKAYGCVTSRIQGKNRTASKLLNFARTSHYRAKRHLAIGEAMRGKAEEDPRRERARARDQAHRSDNTASRPCRFEVSTEHHRRNRPYSAEPHHSLLSNTNYSRSAETGEIFGLVPFASETYSAARNQFSERTGPDADRNLYECGHFFEKVDAAVRIPPLIVVPTHELEKPTIEFHARAGIKY